MNTGRLRDVKDAVTFGLEAAWGFGPVTLQGEYTGTNLVRSGADAYFHGAYLQASYLVTGEHTDGAYFLIEGTVPPGAGPPPHRQTREEEQFYVLEGMITFWVDGGRVEAGPGTFLNVPRGVLHNFRNETDEVGRMLIGFAPAGIEGMFTAMGAEPERYREIAAEYGVVFE